MQGAEAVSGACVRVSVSLSVRVRIYIQIERERERERERYSWIAGWKEKHVSRTEPVCVQPDSGKEDEEEEEENAGAMDDDDDQPLPHLTGKLLRGRGHGSTSQEPNTAGWVC